MEQSLDSSVKPNIVLFMVDQLAAKWLEAAIDGVCTTPNIDRLRSRGTTFTNTISSNPLCCPARATLATGLTTRGHGVLENGYQLDPNLPTFMQALQKGGWRTGAFGKVHYQPHFRTLFPDYHPYGFDVIHNTEDGRGGEWLDWVEKEHPAHYEAVLATIWPTEIPDYAAYGKEARDLRTRIKKIRSSFQWATSEWPLNDGGHYTLPFPEAVSQTNWITGRAEQFIRETAADQPLFAHISYVQPHGPFCAPAAYMEQVNVDEIPSPLPAEWLDEHGPKELKKRTPNIPDKWAYHRQLYFADICHLDQQLGRVLDTLEETRRMDHTYFIFLSDHGELLYDHGFTCKAEKHYDACIRVPLVMAGPGLRQGAGCDAMVQLEDICPTILDMAGVNLPLLPKLGPYLKQDASDIAQLPGNSLLPLCRREEPAGWRQAAYCESYNNISSTDPSQWARTIRTPAYRYTFYPQAHGEQLFDLQQDPDEQTNLAAKPEYATVRTEMRDRLMELMVLQDYPKTRRNLFALGVH